MEGLTMFGFNKKSTTKNIFGQSKKKLIPMDLLDEINGGVGGIDMLPTEQTVLLSFLQQLKSEGLNKDQALTETDHIYGADAKSHDAAIFLLNKVWEKL